MKYLCIASLLATAAAFTTSPSAFSTVSVGERAIDKHISDNASHRTRRATIVMDGKANGRFYVPLVCQRFGFSYVPHQASKRTCNFLMATLRLGQHRLRFCQKQQLTLGRGTNRSFAFDSDRLACHGRFDGLCASVFEIWFSHILCFSYLNSFP